MSKEERTIHIRKDRKHKIEYPYGKNDKTHGYICGPRTRNLWYKIESDLQDAVIAVVPDV